MSEFYIGILMGLNGLLIVLIEMVMIFHLESKNQILHLISNGLILTCPFLPGLYLPALASLTALVSVFLVTLGEIFPCPS